MRAFYDKPKVPISLYGVRYFCDHPLYNECTLYLIGKKGLAVIQQRFDPATKSSWWSYVDPWLANDLYLSGGFIDAFKELSGESKDGLYPTITLRKLMWKLRMKPLKKEYWES